MDRSSRLKITGLKLQFRPDDFTKCLENIPYDGKRTVSSINSVKKKNGQPYAVQKRHGLLLYIKHKNQHRVD